MNTNLLTIAGQLSDDALRSRLKLLAQGSRQTTVELIAHLAEFATRKLHRAEGPGRLFGYCTQILRFSEAAACNRIKAAKAVRKFPVILDLLTDGSVNLTTIRLLAPHLTAENHGDLLAEATGMTRRQVDKLVARLAPKPDVPPSIRKLPAPAPCAQAERGVTATTTAEEEPQSVGAPETSTTPITPPPASHRSVVAPLSPERYRLQLTVGEDTHDDLRCLQELMRREIPDGDPAVIVARALKLLRQEAQRKAFAATPRPRPAKGTKPGSRHIPANVQRTVWERDGGQCAFVAKNGRRCTERSYIEFHHQSLYAFGGEPTVDNISLRCAQHNEYESELIFGPYDPSRVRETPAVYANSIGPLLVPGPVARHHESLVEGAFSSSCPLKGILPDDDRRGDRRAAGMPRTVASAHQRQARGTLGGIETLVEAPARSTHDGVRPASYWSRDQ
jgi:hypothetical protein